MQRRKGKERREEASKGKERRRKGKEKRAKERKQRRRRREQRRGNETKERRGEERKGKERRREQRKGKLAMPSKLLRIAVTSKRQHERPHAYNMQMHIYILHVSLICISNTLAFVFQIHSTKHTRFGPNLGALLPRSHQGAARARSQLMIPTDR